MRAWAGVGGRGRATVGRRSDGRRTAGAHRERVPDRPHRPLTIVCRLVAEQAAAGRLVGQVEVVHTGEVANVGDVAALIDLVQRCAGAEAAD